MNNRPSSLRMWLLIGLLAFAFVALACTRSVPADELPPVPTSAPVSTLPAGATPIGPTVVPTALPDGTVPTPAPTVPTEGQPTAVPTVAGSTGQGQTVHVVAAGDTLYSISLTYGVSTEEIMAANGLTDPNTLVVGTQLVIPAPGTTVVPPPAPTAPAPAPTAVPPVPPTSGGQVYVVQPGNNLFRIGLQYGCTVDQMASYNNIPAPYIIYVGQQILIPPSC
jgi:LysM repeat protein